MRQMVGLYQLANQAAEMLQLEKPSAPDSLRWFFVRQIMIIILPFFFLRRKLNTNVLLTITALALLFWDHPVAIWNTYAIVFKIANYFCLFCSGYALLWLLNLLPYQSSPS